MFSWLYPCKVHCLRFYENILFQESVKQKDNQHKIAFYSIWPPTVFFDSSLSCFPTVQFQHLWWIAIVFLLISKLPCHSPESKTDLSLQDRLRDHLILNSQEANQDSFSPSDNQIRDLEGGHGHTGELIVNWKVIAGMSVTVWEASWLAGGVRWLLAHNSYYEKKEDLFQRSFLVSDSHGRVSMHQNFLVRGLYFIFFMLLCCWK